MLISLYVVFITISKSLRSYVDHGHLMDGEQLWQTLKKERHLMERIASDSWSHPSILIQSSVSLQGMLKSPVKGNSTMQRFHFEINQDNWTKLSY